MTDLAVIEVTQQGDVGGAGVSRFHIGGAGGAPVDQVMIDAAGSHLHDMYTTLAQHVPTSIHFTVQPSGRVITVETGLLEREFTMTNAPGGVQGAGSVLPYVAGTGAKIHWVTNTVAVRRLMRGATFVVPLVSDAFATNGDLSSNTSFAIAAAAAQLLTATTQFSSELRIYHHPPKGTTAGGRSGKVIASNVDVKPAFLKSRRS